MRIALLCNLYYPIAEPFAGGLERQTHQLATGLVAAGEEVTLFAHPKSDFRFDVVPIPFEETPRTRGPAQTYRRVSAYRRMMRAVADRGPFDIVHNNTLHWVPPLWLALGGAASLTTLHTPPYRSLRLAAALSRLRGQPRAVSISTTLGEEWKSALGYLPEVVPNGIDLEEWPLSLTPEPKTAIWYGRLEPEKAPHLAILAARRAGYRLTLAGRIDNEDYYQQQVAPHLGADCSYLGSVSSAELKTRIGQAAVCLFTSVWNEPFGLVLLEAPSCGTPVVAIELGAVTEVLNARMGVRVPFTKSLGTSHFGANAGARGGEEEVVVKRLAEGIRAAAELNRADCRAAVRERFDLNRMTDAYRAVYRTLSAVGEV